MVGREVALTGGCEDYEWRALAGRFGTPAAKGRLTQYPRELLLRRPPGFDCPGEPVRPHQVGRACGRESWEPRAALPPRRPGGEFGDQQKNKSVAGSDTPVPVPLASFLQINPPKQQCQLLSVEADVHRIGPGPPEGALFKTPIAQAITAGFPEQYLEAVSLPIGENMDAAAQGILPQRLSHQSREPIEGLAKVHRIGGHKDDRGGQERRHHGCHPKASSDWQQPGRLILSSARNDLPAQQAITKPSCILLAGAESIRTGTNLGFKTGPSANSLCDPGWPPSIE